MYKNIIFDLGGVVVDFNPRDFLLDYFMNKTVEDAVYDLTFGSKEWEELDAGNISRAAANRIMLENAARVGRVFEVQTVIDEWEKILRTNRSTVKIMMQLKLAGYRLYYCSNMPADTFEQFRRREFFPLFDGGIVSCDVHINKPDPKIFTLLMQKYHLVYEESIFVDDNRANAQAAYNLGITGILFKNKKSFTRALEKCGIQLPDLRAAIQQRKREQQRARQQAAQPPVPPQQ